MNTIEAKIPAYGMPVLEGSVNKPKKVDMAQFMGGDLPPLAPPETGELKPHPPICRPSEHPGSIPGSDLEPGVPGPGMPGGGPPKSPPFPRMESLDVLDGKLYVAEAPYAEISGNITDSAMSGVRYKTEEVCLNGVYIGGDSVYSITNSEFEMIGHGIDDFAGVGAAIMVNNNAKVEMETVNVTTYGVIRPCTVVTGEATLVVRNCVLDAKGGEIPASYIPRVASGMMEPPPGLKLGGNCRTHLSMGNSQAFFYDSKILAHSWAALSTDGSRGDQYLEANNCEIVCDTIGYATYADGGCHNVLNDCNISVDTHVAIIAGDAWVKVNNCLVKSNQYGCMLHGIRGHCSETTECHIVGGEWEIGETLFLVKSENAYIKLDGAKVNPVKYLVHAIINDDPAATKVPDEMKLKCYGINVVIANGDYSGDIVNDDVDRTMNVSIFNANVKGTVTDAYISLEGSTWTATGDSSVCLVGNVQVTQIDAATGITISATAGEGCVLSGEYVLTSGGKLVILRA